MRYGSLCEDVAIELFIDKTLQQITPIVKCTGFIKDEKFYNAIQPINGQNSTSIKKSYCDVAKQAIGKYELDLFIFSYDADDLLASELPRHISQQIDKIDIRARRKSILCLPSQSIEYWLCYIKNYSEEIQEGQLESDTLFNREKAKSIVYERELESNGKYKKQASRIETSKAGAILQNLNLHNLLRVSPSFRLFVNQVKAFSDTYCS